MALTDTLPLTDSVHSARREESAATARLVAGIAISIGGIAGLLAIFVLTASLGGAPTVAQGTGLLLLAVVAFGVSAWGTDIRHTAHAQRRSVRARIAQLEASAHL